MTQPRPKLVLAFGFIAMLSVGFFALAAYAHTTGESFTAGLMATFGVYITAMLAAALVLRYRPRRDDRRQFTLGHTREGEAALFAPAPRGKAAVSLGFTVISALVALGFVALSLAGGGLGMLLLAAAAGALPVAVLVTALRGRLHRGYLALSPTGIELQSWQEGVYVPWAEMAEVCQTNRKRHPLHVLVMLDTTEPTDSAVRTWHPAARMMRTTLPPFEPTTRIATITVESAGVQVDVLMALLWHYWTQPEQRGELATHAGLQRLIQHQLDSPVWASPEQAGHSDQQARTASAHQEGASL